MNIYIVLHVINDIQHFINIFFKYTVTYNLNFVKKILKDPKNQTSCSNKLGSYQKRVLTLCGYIARD